MKKTLAAVAVLGAFAGSALAADVTLYGRVNLGVNYFHTDDGSNTESSFSLNSGDASASRFGLKGSEQISEGLKVGFQLEQRFNADDGRNSESDKAFRGESRLYVATDFGTLHMGRFGALDSAAGSLDLVGGLSAMGTGYGELIGDQGRVMKTLGRMDNSVAYTSPEFAGVTVSAMASLKNSNSNGKFGEEYKVSKSEEGSSDADRYYGLGVKGQWGALGATFVVSQQDMGKVDSPKAVDDPINYTAGVNYDFGFAKAFLAANYYDRGEYEANKEESQWGVSTSVAAPLAAGTLEAAVGYGVKTAEEVNKDDVDTKVLNIGVAYKYPLSKRTYVYAGAGYDQEKTDGKDKVKSVEAVSGIVHSF